jgi:Protein phosphatase 2C
MPLNAKLQNLLPVATTLARMETRWQKPWLIAGLSHWGQHHADIGLPNQDAFAFGSLGGVTWLALADGVSSAPLSGEGADRVTAWAGAEIEARLRRRSQLTELDVRDVVEAVRNRLAAHAQAYNKPLADYATTLLMAVLGEDGLIFAKIGDGYVFAVERGDIGARLRPIADSGQLMSGETVLDLTHPEWAEHLVVQHFADGAAAGIDTIALGSDGCSRYFVRAEHAGSEHQRRAVLSSDIVGAYFTDTLAQLGPRNLFVCLANLLGNLQFVDEGDDRTLLIATRRPLESVP